MAIKGSGSNPTHHVVLSDGKKKVGLLITDNQGNRNEKTFRRFPRSDPQSPYTQETQSDWSLGLGSPVFEENRSAYWRSEGLDLTKAGSATLGAHYYYAKGYRKADTYWPTTGLKRYNLCNTARYRATKFTVTESMNVTGIRFWACYRGRPDDLTIELRNSSGGNPSTVLQTVTLDRSDASTNMALIKVAITSQALVASALAWVSFKAATTDDERNCWIIGGYPDSTATFDGKISANGTDWTASDEYFFRVTETDVPFVSRFYQYRGQLYTVLDYDTRGESDIYMNGWRGLCNDNSGNKTRLNDSTQTGWANDAAAGCVARVVAGEATGELDDWRAITGSASGYVTCDSTWRITQDTKDDYVILGSDKWFEIPKPAAMAGRISSVAVANGIVYFCQGNRGKIYMHREYNDGTWMNDNTDFCWLKTDVIAQFAITQTDPISGDTIWFGKNTNEFGKWKPEVWRALAPSGWDSKALNNVQIDDLDTQGAWSAGATTVTVTKREWPDVEQTIRVIIGRVTAINATPTAAGSGYTVGDDLTITKTGVGASTGLCKVNVDTINGSGGVTALSLITTDKGWDYAVGSGKATTGGTGTGCTVEITTVESFSTGTVAYQTLVDSTDLRWCNRLKFMIKVNKFMSPGDLSWGLDDDSSFASTYNTTGLPKLKPGVWHIITMAIDLEDIEEAEETDAIGLILNVAKTKTFTIQLSREIMGINKFETIPVGEDGDNITGLELFGDPATLWVFTETGMGEVRNNVFQPVELRELKVARHVSNGKAHTVNDVYLYFSWKGRMERYYRQTLEDLGPDFPEEFGNIRGQVSFIQTYAGRIYVAIDGGDSRPSMILVYKGHAWHEVFTSLDGERIRSLHIQAIPGKSDRLWFSVGGDLCYMPIELDPTNLSLDTDFAYRPEGHLITSWIYTSRRDIKKLFTEVQVFAEDLAPTGQFIDIEYKLDENSNPWKMVATIRRGEYTKKVLDPSFPPDAARGYRIRFRFRFRTNSSSTAPILNQFVLDAYRIPRVKYGYSFLTKVSTMSIDLRGDESRIFGTFRTVESALKQLDRWATQMTPLAVKETSIAELQGKVVILEPIPTNIFRVIPEEKIQEDIIQITVNEF